ncbi:hypothetical protein DTL42_24720 [Bremerella cremea]|uniref:Uncharacterized protein n=1 Tax=Bremerella cremea TaxID=1031537 RepID=A0A368KLD7_9BACT|nr:hypothetical protein [Bremerella cremea]RCS40578.1 hypothetical protein DTL42_24720 [Bremerella cremea]
MRIAKTPYFIWLTTFVCLAVFANWPVRTGIPVGFFTYVGFPWQFALWSGGALVDFDSLALTLDISIWLSLLAVAPWALSRRPRSKKASPA